ncbi:MAG TPA: hypothetical protein VFX51_16230 [Solirubrobacteraceae bacterium]|nr:hypothetical protein [Solirubrobacteraceae bacterium]
MITWKTPISVNIDAAKTRPPTAQPDTCGSELLGSYCVLAIDQSPFGAVEMVRRPWVNRHHPRRVISAHPSIGDGEAR